jgi:hypothetical protein
MPDAMVRLDTTSRGASLRAVARQLRDMDDTKLKRMFKDRLVEAARPFVPAVRASAMAIPAHGPATTGLRSRIAACATVGAWDSGARQVSVAVEIEPGRMPSGEKGLPLYMEGVGTGRHDRWRHPVFGRREDHWVQQPSHPYFYQAASGFGRAAGEAMRAAVEDITRQLE